MLMRVRVARFSAGVFAMFIIASRDVNIVASM